VLLKGMGMPVRLRGGVSLVEREGVSALGKFDSNGVGGAFAGIVLGEFSAQAASLDADHGIDGGVKIGGPAELFCSNLVFLNGAAGMLDGVMR